MHIKLKIQPEILQIVEYQSNPPKLWQKWNQYPTKICAVYKSDNIYIM